MQFVPFVLIRQAMNQKAATSTTNSQVMSIRDTARKCGLSTDELALVLAFVSSDTTILAELSEFSEDELQVWIEGFKALPEK
jgi:hypothetical protein